MIIMLELDEMEKEIALSCFQLGMERGEKSILEEGIISAEELREKLGI